jgi:hypothetical protein
MLPGSVGSIALVARKTSAGSARVSPSTKDLGRLGRVNASG